MMVAPVLPLLLAASAALLAASASLFSPDQFVPGNHIAEGIKNSSIHRRSKMARSRRSNEDKLWGNPCDYSDDSLSSGGLPKTPPEFKPELAKLVANQARNTFFEASNFKDHLAQKLYSHNKFEDMLPQWESDQWLLAKSIPMATLPKEQTRLEQPVSQENLKKVLSNIDGTLPSIHKALKILIGGLNTIKQNGFNPGDFDITGNFAENLQNDFEATMNHCRQVLCNLNDVLASRKVETIPLNDSEIPDVQAGDRLANIFLIYRDTLLFLDWLAQLMDALASQG